MQLLTHQTLFAFELRACAYAVIQITNGREATHELIIGSGSGDDQRTLFRDLKEDLVLAQAQTPNVINCDMHTKLWIEVKCLHAFL